MPPWIGDERRQHRKVLVFPVIGLTVGPGRVVGRHDAAAVGADELALGDDVGDPKPDFGVRSALVLRLGAGHGQVGAQLGAKALRLCGS